MHSAKPGEDNPLDTCKGVSGHVEAGKESHTDQGLEEELARERGSQYQEWKGHSGM